MLLMMALWGCTTTDLPQESALDRLRLLGAQAEPAEPRPGQGVTLRSLSWSAAGDVGVVWELCTTLACPSTTWRDDPEALLDAGVVDVEDGIIGLEPDAPPAAVVPDGLLDALDADERQEGVVVTFGLAATDGDEVEWGQKVLPVSEAQTPNNNPVLVGITIDETETVLDGEAISVDAEVEVSLALLDEDDIVEDYLFTNSDGEAEERTESLQVSWYTDLGTLDQSRWTPAAGSGELIVVVRDGRGGTGWMVFNVETR
ncbi:MAG: hypothetical protein AAFV53_21790 [Myxococcota bacterium]